MMPYKFRAALVFLSALIVIVNSYAYPTVDDKKLKPEELIAKHLESIGSKEALEAAKTRAVTGTVRATRRIGNAGDIVGKGLFISESPKLLYSMKFSASQYPAEQMAFDGARSATGFLPEGKRSNLSQFLDQQSL